MTNDREFIRRLRVYESFLNVQINESREKEGRFASPENASYRLEIHAERKVLEYMRDRFYEIFPEIKKDEGCETA